MFIFINLTEKEQKNMTEIKIQVPCVDEKGKHGKRFYY